MSDIYTEREMRLIFERAGEAGAQADADRRYTLAEIQDIALQAGLDPGDVARAAATLRSQPRGGLWFGAPVQFRAARVVAHEWKDGDVLDTMLSIRDHTGLHGELKEVPGGMEWRGRSAMGYIIVSFARASSGTRVDVVVARGDQAMLTVMLSGVVGFATLLAAAFALDPIGEGPALAGAAVAALGSAWGATRLMWARIARRWSAEAAALSQTVADAMDAHRGDHRDD